VDRAPASRGRDVAVLSSTEIRVVSPPGKGTVNVRVVTKWGMSPKTKADRFTYK